MTGKLPSFSRKLLRRYLTYVLLYIMFCHIFSPNELSHFPAQMNGYMQLLQFYVDSFEPLQVFRPQYENMHFVWIKSSYYFWCFFHKWTKSFLRPKWTDTRCLVYATPPAVLCWFLWNFTGVKIMVLRYLYCLDISPDFFLLLTKCT